MCFRVMGVIASDRKHFSNTDPLCIAPAQVCVCGGGGGGGKIGLLLFDLGFLVVSLQFFVCLFDFILYVHSTIFQLCGTVLPGFNQY